jgi:tetratricopeptide (TPR) repeat protein
MLRVVNIAIAASILAMTGASAAAGVQSGANSIQPAQGANMTARGVASPAPQKPPPTYFDLVPPQSYTTDSMMEELRRRLTPEELKLVVNPLLGSPEIDRWARQLTASATNDDARARMIFEELAHHAQKGNTNMEGEMRTAQEVFAVWDKPGVSLFCKDYAFLYVVMARAVGIKAYDVDVEEEGGGYDSAHACAAILLGNKGLLVDPAGGWFGPPYKKFIVLSDLQSIGLYVVQLQRPGCTEIARKLAPELALVELNAFEYLVNSGRLNDARDVLQTLKRLEIPAATRAYAAGKLAFGEGRAEDAVDMLLNAIDMDPVQSSYRVCLGEAYVEAGDVKKAVGSFEAALRCPMTARDAEFTRMMLSDTNVLAGWGLVDRANKILMIGDFVNAVKYCDKAIALMPDYADAYYVRSLARQRKGDTNGALDDYKTAIRLKPELRPPESSKGTH